MQIGRYRVVEEIARGGMGVVYRAQGPDGRDVALKLLLAQRAAEPRSRKRFQLEVETLARLHHPNVVRILGAGEHEACPWLALEFVEGQSLQDRLRLQGPLPVGEAIRVARQLAQALSYVHSTGLLHRDLKPDNVLLQGDQALLTDFGLALDEQSSRTRITTSGIFLGTPGYWAPEQARGETSQFGPATDVFGLGGVLYACLTGQAPVSASSLQEYLQTASFSMTRAPRRLRPEVPEWLSALCMRCLAQEQTKRPASAEDVARALVLGDSAQKEPRGKRSGAPLLGAAVVLGALVALVALARLGGWTVGATTAPPEVATPNPTEAPGPAEEKQPEPAVGRSEQAAALLASGNTKAGQRRHEEAIEDFDQALKLDPRAALAYRLRGQSRRALGRDEEAIEDFGQALALNPDSATWAQQAMSKVTLGRVAEAITDFDRALELNPRDASSYAYRGRSHSLLGHYADAIADYNSALALNPEDPVLYGDRGRSLQNLGRHAAALEDYNRALELNPQRVEGYLDRAMCNFCLDRKDEALEDYTRALELNPRDAVAYSTRGMVYQSLGRYAEAAADFDRALALNPRDAKAYGGRGAAKQGLLQIEEAIADFDRALELNPRDAETYMLRGVARDSQGRWAEAIADFDRTLELSPTHADACRFRGQAKQHLGRLEDAIADYDRALALEVLHPEDAEAVRQARDAAAAKLQE